MRKECVISYEEEKNNKDNKLADTLPYKKTTSVLLSSDVPTVLPNKPQSPITSGFITLPSNKLTMNSS